MGNLTCVAIRRAQLECRNADTLVVQPPDQLVLAFFFFFSGDLTGDIGVIVGGMRAFGKMMSVSTTAVAFAFETGVALIAIHVMERGRDLDIVHLWLGRHPYGWRRGLVCRFI